jgi:ketosteroid isomerase-like protein
MGTRVHVMKHDNGWAYRKEGSSRVSATFSTQDRAIQAGRKAAVAAKTELLIHGRDGRIRDSRSYGNDPFPPRDKH